jgi:hypothetical protein
MYDALQELRIQYRWQAMSEENRMRDLCKEKGIEFKNTDTQEWRYHETAARTMPLSARQEAR